MYRILIMLLKIAFFLVVIVISVFAQEFQREIDTIPVFIDGKLISRPFAGGVQWPKPTLADIDNDGDWDLFVGDQDGSIHFYRNIGTVTEPDFAFETENFADIDVGVKCAPTFADIDNDGDFDLFVGEGAFIWPRYYGGNVNFYRNIGTPTQPNFTLVTKNFADINVQSAGGGGSRSAFADIDNDGDLDLFVGGGEGRIHFYQNTGTATNPIFTLETTNFADLFAEFDILVVGWSVPKFVDIDNDGDLDLFMGVGPGRLLFYRNTGTPAIPIFMREKLTNSVKHSSHLAPTFADIDNDGDLDLFVRYTEGSAFYLNNGTAASPSFVLIPRKFPSVDVSGLDKPTFVDIDDDGDFDLFVGKGDNTSYMSGGNISFYRNTGTAAEPILTLETNNFADIHVPSHAGPAFVDIDNDGDLDLFVGEQDGGFHFFRNTMVTNVTISEGQEIPNNQ